MRWWEQRAWKGLWSRRWVKRKWTGKEDCPIPSGKRETEHGARDLDSSIINEERDESRCSNSTHSMLSTAISQKSTSNRCWLFRLLLTPNQINEPYLIWMAKSEIQTFSSMQIRMLPQSQLEICLVCSFTCLVLLNRIQERYFTSLWIGNLLNEKWIPKLLLSKQWHQLLISNTLIIEHPSM